MNRRNVDVETAIQALAVRLQGWGVIDPAPKARAFVEDMRERGWTVALDRAPRQPPKPHEECGDHPGEYRLSCRAHAADRKARRDQADRAALTARNLTANQAIREIRATLHASRQENP